MTPLPRLGPADRTVNAAPELAQEAVDPGEAVRQWVARIRHVMDAGNHTLGLNGRYLGQGGTEALLVAVNLMEEEDKEDEEDETLSTSDSGGYEDIDVEASDEFDEEDIDGEEVEEDEPEEVGGPVEAGDV